MQTDISIPRQTTLPSFATELDLFNREININTPSKFISAPKLAMYYGVLDFSGATFGGYYQFGFIDYAAAVPMFQLINFIPTFFQVFPDNAGYFAAFGDIPYNLSYASLEYDNYPTPAFTILGLIDRYHSKYLSIIYNDKRYSLRARVRLSDYRTDLFKQPKTFKIGGQLVKGWQMSTESFSPVESDLADIIIIGDYDNIKSSTYSENSNRDIPELTIGYIFELTK